MTFRILTVDPKSVVGDEQLGSKNKFWFQRGEERWLFKEARANTGEDWAEKIAAEIARLIGIRCAEVELAQFEGHPGVACRSFIRGRNVALVHENEILAGQIVGYDRDKRLHQSDHTLANIVMAVRKLVGSAEEAVRFLTLLCSYFVLDGLICNTDRHHENWGLLIRLEPSAEGDSLMLMDVAPSYDHASSLGRELVDERRTLILEKGDISRYARNGTGGIYLDGTQRKGANPLELVRAGMQTYPEYFGPALQPFVGVHAEDILRIVDQVPESRMSETAKVFAKELLTFTS